MAAAATIFHILDAYTQDLETGKKVIPAQKGDLLFSEEEEAEGKKLKRGGAATAGDSDAADPLKLRMNIFLFGKTAEGIPIRACVEGFQPFFFVRLPDSSSKTKTLFKMRLEAVLERRRNWLRKLVHLSFEDRKVLYGYTANKSYPFVRLSVPSMTAFRALKSIFLSYDTNKPCFELYAGQDALEVYEANLDPMLRFFHLRDIQPCGWVQTEMEHEEGEDLVLDWTELSPCRSPPMASAPFLMAAWDIECYSENGEFPLAKKSYDRLAKQIFAAATDPVHAAELILGAATDPDSPPEGVDGLRHRDGGLKVERLQSALESEVFQQGLEPLLEKREGLVGPAKEDRIQKIRGVLAGSLRTALPLAGDPVIQIGVVLVRGGVTAEKHIFVLGSCDPVPGAIVHSYSTEAKMILGWAAAMQAWNPDILMGYNVFGFDERYLWDRAAELRITEAEAFQSLSRLLDMQKALALETKFLSSSALGDNTMWMWSTFGRLQVDLYHYIKRSFSLPAYKLDFVCQHFMSGKLGGVVTEDPELEAAKWFLKTKATGDAVVGRYVTLLDETGDAVVEKLRISAIRDKEGLVVEEPVGIAEEDLADLKAALPDAVKWAIVKDDVSPQDIFRLHKEGGAAGRAKVAAYCVQDCDLTVELYKKLDVFNNAMAMANACSVPVGYIFTRGQGIKIESLIFKECYQRGQAVLVLPTQPRAGAKGPEEGEDEEDKAQEESYEGAIVLTPNPGFYFKSPVGVADFASLYPSTIISENISHDTLVWAKDYDLSGNFIGYSYGSKEAEGQLEAGGSAQAVAWTEIDFDIWGTKEGDTRKNPEKVKKGLRVCRYAQFAGDSKGTLPDIVQKLLAARKAKRKEAEKECDPFKKALLDAEQLAYKLTANSLYGQLGSSTFKIRLQHLAASVTAYGRKQILFAKAAIERFYGPAAGRADCTAEAAQVVYGDSVGEETFLYSLREKGGAPLPALKVKQLADLYENHWIPCIEEGRQEKEACETPGLETLTEQGWTAVHRIIRHKLSPTKKMLRVHYGSHVVPHFIDVTEDHSMVLASGTAISPKDLVPGDLLLQTEGSGLEILKVEPIHYEGYVYDLTTENHHFQAGPGGLVVHNTDSLFVCFNPKNPETGQRLEGREAIVATMKLTEEAGKLVTSCLKAPHDFEYEKVFTPFIIFSKKRYVGNKYEDSPDDYYQNSMGIATKRRDYAGIVKVIYGGAIRILLTEKDPAAAAQFVKDKLMDLAEGRTSLTQLTMTKSLRADYKSPTPPAHKMLADRIKARDPGNAPASGDRISFLYILPPTGQQASKLQGDRIETPGHIKEKKLAIDFKFYMEHQLMNPISQLFALCVEDLPGCKAPGGRSWSAPEGSRVPVADAADREYAASEYLFRDALNACDKAAQRRLATKFFGGSVLATAAGAATATPLTATPKRRTTVQAILAPPPPVKPKVQANLNMFSVQAAVLKVMEKEMKASKAKSNSSRDSSPTTPSVKGKRAKKAGAGGAGVGQTSSSVVIEI